MEKKKIFLIAAIIASLSVIVSHLAAEKEPLIKKPLTDEPLIDEPLIDEKRAESDAIPVYPFSKKYRSQWALPKILQEVSGVAVLDSENLLLHNDESAVVFEFNLDTHLVVPRFQLGDPVLKVDIEGIALLREDVYLVTSTGKLYRVPGGVVRTGVIEDYEVLDTGLKKVCEVEGLAEDLLAGSLVMACKQMLDKDAEYISVYRFTPATGRAEKLFDVSFSRVGQKVHATAIETQFNGYVVLFGKEKLIGHLDRQGSVLKLQPLKKKHHPQPEGLGFLKDGSLVLADEGKKGKGRITIYRPMIGL